MISFKAQTNKGTLSISCKSSWDELNLAEFMKLEKIGPNKLAVLEIFEIISGVAVEQTANFVGSETEAFILQACDFVTKAAPDFENIQPPSKLLIGGKLYAAPLDFNLSMLGQKILLKQLTIDNADDLLAKLPEVLAIYMQPIIDGKFDDKRLGRVAEILKTSPAVPCFGLARFFFLHSLDLSFIGIRSLQPSQPAKPTPTKD